MNEPPESERRPHSGRKAGTPMPVAGVGLGDNLGSQAVWRVCRASTGQTAPQPKALGLKVKWEAA